MKAVMLVVVPGGAKVWQSRADQCHGLHPFLDGRAGRQEGPSIVTRMMHIRRANRMKKE